MAATFHHFGVPTSAKGDNETYLEGAKLFITDPEAHAYRIEFLRFEAGSEMHEALQNNCHAAFVVENLEQALADQNVIIEPFDATDEFRVAFIKDGDAVIELMEKR